MLVQRLNAQVLYGSVVGTVTDQTGAVVPNATITITNVNTGQTREGTTDATGYYSIPNALEGTYDLSVKMTGFRPYLQKGVVVSINTVARVNLSLQLGAVTESVTVEAGAALLQTTKSDVSTSLESRAVENLPLSNYRNFQTLDQSGARRHTGSVSERRGRYTRTRLKYQCQRPAARRQQHPSGRFG